MSKILAAAILVAMSAGGVAAARDAASGIATGKRMHGSVATTPNSSRSAAPSPLPIPYPTTGKAGRSNAGPQPGGARMRR